MSFPETIALLAGTVSPQKIIVCCADIFDEGYKLAQKIRYVITINFIHVYIIFLPDGTPLHFTVRKYFT
jgi:hypothetical protein